MMRRLCHCLRVSVCSLALLLGPGACGPAVDPEPVEQPAATETAPAPAAFPVLPEAPLLRLGRETSGLEAVTIDQVTMPALSAGDARGFVTTAQPGMRFSAFIGGTGTMDADALPHFQVWVETEHGRVLLAEQVLEEAARWRALHADLSPYAGQELRVLLEVAPASARLYWGNPVLSTAATAPDRPPVVLISLDTLRADHLSAHGYHRETTPHLDRFAREDAALFENAFTPETWTLPSHMTMLTGLLPPQHGVARDRPLQGHIRTLQEVLQQESYLTAAFTGHTWWFQPANGFARGFDHYDNAPDMLRHIHKTRERLYDWLEGQDYAPQFLFFHSYDAHYKIREQDYDLPYEPGDPAWYHFLQPYLEQAPFQDPDKRGLRASELLHAARAEEISFTELELETVVAGYDDAIRMVDHAVGEIFERLKTAGLYEEALIIITSDHGEGMGERGYFDHEDVWEEEAHVPMLVKFPDKAFAGVRFSGQVGLEDIFPTVLAELGMVAPPELSGRDLRALLAGEAEPAEYLFLRNGGGRLAVRTPKWKLHWRPFEAAPHRLYHLPSDPGELHDVYETQRAAALPLQQAAREFFRIDQPGWQIELLAESDTAWRGALQLETEQPLLEAVRVDGWGNPHPLEIEDGRRIRVELGRTPPERITLHTAGHPDTLRIQLRAGRDFRFAAAGQAPELLTEVNTELETGAEGLPRPAPAPDQTVPQISVWHIGPEHE